MALRCKVITPDALSYKETVPKRDRYSISDNRVINVKNMILNYEKNYRIPNYSRIIDRWIKSIGNMIDIMKGNQI